VVAWLTACSQAPSLPPAASATLYVIDRGWHTEIALATDAIPSPLAAIADAFPGARYLAFGFGDRNYLMRRETDFFDMLAAMLPGRGAILVTALRAPLPRAFGEDAVIPLRISEAGLDGIGEFLWNSLEKDPSGRPVGLADGPYPGSVFYASARDYDGFYTCNTWVAEGLRAGDLPVVSVGVLVAGQLTSQARTVMARQAAELAARHAGGK
jgi:hypothetical protein